MTDKTDSKEREALIRAITSMCHDMDNDSITITRRKGEGPALRQLLDAMQCELASLAANAGSEPVARVNDEGFIVEIGDLLIAPGQKLYLRPSPPEGMVGGWTKASQQLPPCGDGQLFIGVNSAGFACVFNEITSNIVGAVHCLYETAEECLDVMSGLDLWQPFTPPTSSADSRKGE